jgi:hypothetical protein
MLIRISLIVAVVAGLAVAVINFVQVKEVITTTRNDLNTTSNTLVTTQADLSKTKKALKGTEAELASTKETLRTTEEARAAAIAEADSSKKRANQLSAQLKTTTQERDVAQGELAAWEALGISVDGVKGKLVELKEAQEEILAQKDEITVLSRSLVRATNQLALLIDPEFKVKLPEGLKGTVVVSDPKWDFVVLDIGEDQGVLEKGELLVNRDGKLVAKVRVFRVEKNRSIANLVGGWRIGDIVEGDKAIPAF